MHSLYLFLLSKTRVDRFFIQELENKLDTNPSLESSIKVNDPENVKLIFDIVAISRTCARPTSSSTSTSTTTRTSKNSSSPFYRPVL
jgi:hypothetical protein